MKNVNFHKGPFMRGILGSRINLVQSANEKLYPVMCFEGILKYFNTDDREVVMNDISNDGNFKMSFNDPKIRLSRINIRAVNWQVEKNTIDKIVKRKLDEIITTREY